MLSGEVTLIPYSSIIINPARRQRTKEVDLKELSHSIRINGLIHPILVMKDTLELIAGEQRYKCVGFLGWDTILVHWAEDFSEDQLQQLQLEENTKRTELDWQDECTGILNYHNFKLNKDKDWTITKTAIELNLSANKISNSLSVGKALGAGDETVRTASTYSTARGIVTRKLAREKEASLEKISAPKPNNKLFINEDFTTWVANYEGPPFNVFHCDFPYGINTDKHDSSTKGFVDYKDTEEIFFTLLDTFVNSSIIAPSAHLIFWFSMHHYSKTIFLLREKGWVINPYPLIWKKTVAGILPDPAHSYRHLYETAFFGTKGKRLIIKSSTDIIERHISERSHKSEKAFEAVKHFLKPLVDHTTRLLDPTAGCGNAVIACKELGGYAQGIEQNKDIYEIACRNAENRL